jgi:aspartyl protease family protein
VSTPFDPQGDHILIDARLEGPTGGWSFRLALDTGSTWTVVDARLLAAIGCGPAQASVHIDVTTGSGLVRLPQVRLVRLEALGQQRSGCDVLAHTLPPSAGIDGVLGLDFLRGHVLKIDFGTGLIDLA